jgi:hypothetical protein
MSGPLSTPPQGRAAPVLLLCRQCLRYVFEGTAACPHCGRDAREIGARYLDGGYLAIETMQRIDRAVERRDSTMNQSRDRRSP